MWEIFFVCLFVFLFVFGLVKLAGMREGAGASHWEVMSLSLSVFEFYLYLGC